MLLLALQPFVFGVHRPRTESNHKAARTVSDIADLDSKFDFDWNSQNQNYSDSDLEFRSFKETFIESFKFYVVTEIVVQSILQDNMQ